MKKITSITRSDIKDILIYEFDKENMKYYGILEDELDFLERIYDLDNLPSTDSRFKNAKEDICQHTINNDDWSRNWIYSDSRFGLMEDDEKLLNFICEVFHPIVRNEKTPWKEYYNRINDLLKEDGYELYEEKKISGKSVYSWKLKDAIIKNQKSEPLNLKEVGRGSYAKVYSFTDDFYKIKFALKRANSDISEKDYIRFKREYEIMKILYSPYVVEVYCYFEDKKEYIMEYMDTTIYDYVQDNNNTKEFDFIKRFGFITQILNCFLYLESKEILHRDISYKNILLKIYENVIKVKISDFGLVKLKDSTLTDPNTEFRGSLNDPKLENLGMGKYSIQHETYALTRLITFILTGKTNYSKIKNSDIKLFFEKGINDNLEERYQNISEIHEAFKKLKKKLIL